MDFVGGDPYRGMWDLYVLVLPSTHQFDSIQQVKVDWMMNMDILMYNYQFLDWMSCRKFKLIGFMFLGYFTSQTHWILSIVVILSVWGKIHGSLEGLELKIGEEKSENPFVGTDSICQALARHARQSVWGQCLSIRLWLSVPLSTSRPRRDPVLSLSFHTSS